MTPCKAICGQEGEEDRSSGSRLPTIHEGGVRRAAEELINFIFPSDGSCEENRLRQPLVILAFDDAHQLVGRPYYPNVGSGGSTVLSHLRQVMALLQEQPIFALFISTAADKFKFYGGGEVRDLCPFTETSFDALAYNAEEGVTTLDEVARDEWMVHLGRPMFGSPSQLLRWRIHLSPWVGLRPTMILRRRFLLPRTFYVLLNKSFSALPRIRATCPPKEF